MLSRILALTVACLLLAASAAPSAQARWRRVDTPNFVVIGDVSAGTLRDVGTRFEGFREALGRILSERLVVTVVPTMIVVFSSDEAYKPYKPKYGGRAVEVGGTFMAGRDVHYITIGDAARLETLFHEYTHLLLQNTGLTIPLWLGEGLAEYYSTLSLRRSGRQIEVGGLIGGHLDELNEKVLIPLEQFVQLTHDSPLYNEGSRRSVLYAQAWAMTHMLQLGDPPRRAELARYLDLVTSGMPSLEAWKDAFAGVDVMKDLRQYVRRRLFNAGVSRLEGRAALVDKLPVVDLTRADAEAYLAQLLLRLGERDAAGARLASARQRDAGASGVPVSEAMLALSTGDHQLATQRLQEVKTGDDWLASYLSAVSLADLMERDSGMMTDANMASVRAHFQASARSRPMVPHAAYRLASLEIRRGAVRADTKSALDQARVHAPGRYEYQLLYAQLLGRGGDFPSAQQVLGPLMTPGTPPHVREFARRLMGSIAEAQLGKSLPDVALDEITSRPGSETPDGPPRVRPAYRETKPGETRLEGVLQSIECVAGKGITFHVGAGGNVELFIVPTFDAVEFITYRKDLADNIGCGPLKPPMAVYLTWRAGSTPGVRVPVAIEFLPAK